MSLDDRPADWVMEAVAEAMAEAEAIEAAEQHAELIVGELIDVALGVAVKLGWGPDEGANVRRVLDRQLFKHGFTPDPDSIYRKKPIPAALRRAVLERDAYRCQWPACGTWLDLTVDHILAESLGGPTELDNLQTLCRPHNSSKGVKAL